MKKKEFLPLWVITSSYGPRYNHVFMAPCNPCLALSLKPSWEGQQYRCYSWLVDFFLKQAFCWQMCKSAPTYTINSLSPRQLWTAKNPHCFFSLGIHRHWIFLARSTCAAIRLPQGLFDFIASTWGSHTPGGSKSHTNIEGIQIWTSISSWRKWELPGCPQLGNGPESSFPWAPEHPGHHVWNVDLVGPGWAHFIIMKNALFFFCVIFFQSIMLAHFFFQCCLRNTA